MTFKIVRFICGGMDVHKNLIVATVGTTDRQTLITEYIQQSFSTFYSDLIRLKEWFISHDCYDVCMESTGKYWIPVFNLLEEISLFYTGLKSGWTIIPLEFRLKILGIPDENKYVFVVNFITENGFSVEIHKTHLILKNFFQYNSERFSCSQIYRIFRNIR